MGNIVHISIVLMHTLSIATAYEVNKLVYKLMECT